MKSPDLSIIIVNWKSTSFLRKCLQSVADNAGGVHYEVVVIDNASFDGCEEMLVAEFPSVEFIQSAENLGFARANNAALARSWGRNVLFLNPDTEVLGDAIQRLLCALASIEDAGMVGAHLLNSDLSLQSTCITAVPAIANQAFSSDFLRHVFPKWRIWGMRALFEEHVGPVEVEAISGACMMAPRSVLERVGGFSTDYFMYVEDMDLSVKVVKAGWKIYYVPEAKIIHHGGRSSSSRAETSFSALMIRRSLMQFFRSHRGVVYAATYRSSVFVTAALRVVLLTLGLPMLLSKDKRESLARAGRKWSHILAWSVGLAR